MSSGEMFLMQTMHVIIFNVTKKKSTFMEVNWRLLEFCVKNVKSSV